MPGSPSRLAFLMYLSAVTPLNRYATRSLGTLYDSGVLPCSSTPATSTLRVRTCFGNLEKRTSFDKVSG